MSSNAEKLFVDKKINTERCNKILIQSVFGVFTKKINKWGIKMGPIDIHVAVNC